jgi:hypothetical protein
LDYVSRNNLLNRREERAFPRQFQPRKMLVVVDDVVNDAEVNMVGTVTGEGVFARLEAKLGKSK